MDLRQIEIFLKVAEVNSFTKAADELYITQQAVSKRIAELETELGLKLLERTTKKVKLTEMGELAYYKFKRSISMLDKSLVELKEYAQGSAPLLKVGIYNGIRKYITANVMSRIYEILPASTVEIFIFPHVGGEQEVDRGKVDLLFTYIDDMEKWKDYGTCVIKTVPSIFVVSDKHPWTTDNRVGKHQLKKETFVRLSRYIGAVESTIYQDMPCARVLEKENMETLLHEVEYSGGFAMFPEEEEFLEGFHVKKIESTMDLPFHKMAGVYDKDSENPLLKKILKIFE